MRTWTLEEATAALPRVREVVTRIRRLAAAASARANGHRPSLSASLAAAIEELTSEGIIVRDPVRGLVDFPAVSPSGRPYLLCWLDGEDAIGWWHWQETGFAGRTPLHEPPP